MLKERLIALTEGKTPIIIAIIFGLAVMLAAGAVNYAQAAQRGISDSVIRFHVLPDSNSERDQALKIAVRDKVCEMLAPRLNETETIEETRAVLLGSLQDIEQTALEVINEQGFSYGVKAELTAETFPTRRYDNARLPAGVYETLKVTIGNGAGDNWWCVMFPQMCFAGGRAGFADESEKAMKNVLTYEEFNLVFSEKPSYKIKFRVVEIWQDIKGVMR